MLAVKEAVKISLENLADLFPGEAMPGLRLEEVMRSEDENKWQVTVSYENPDFDRDLATQDRVTTGLHSFVGGQKKVPTRLYKTVTLKAEDGALLGIRNEWEISQH